MTGVFLTSCTDFFLIRWIANILGFIMNLFYELISNFGIGKISICIIVFTIIVRLLMLPMNIKQQKSMKLNSLVTPEIQAIQKKYANKKDQESMMKQSAEMNAVYQKYGTSPTSGCLPMLIQMPIIFALYAIMACLPNYIDDIQDMYNNGVVSYVNDSIEELKDIDGLSDLLLAEEKDDKLDTMITAYYGKDGKNSKSEVEKTIYDSFTSAYSRTFNVSAWDAVEAGFSQAIENIDKIVALEEGAWDKVEDKQLLAYKDYSDEQWNEIKDQYTDILGKMEKNRSQIKEAYSFFTIDLSVSPANGVKLAIIIPILSALTQLLSMKISMSAQKQTGNETADQMMSSMKMMSYSMCAVSAIFTYTLPAGMGLYWVTSSGVQCLIQYVTNKHFAKIDVDEILKENLEKANKAREKQGYEPSVIANAASVNTKKYDAVNKTQESESVEPAKKGSIADKANLASKYAEKK